MRSSRRLILLSLILSMATWLLAACTAAPVPPSTPTPTPFPTATRPPTVTPSPTATASPSATPLPTATPSPTPIPLAAWLQEGDALLRRSDFAGAEAAYQRAIEIDDAYAPAYIGLAWVYAYQTARQDEALAQAETAVELAPESAEAHSVLSRAHIVRANPDPAVVAAEEAAGLDETSALVQAVLSRAYLQDRQYEVAGQAAEEAIALDPELAEAYDALGGFYWATADFCRAGTAWEKAVELEPAFVPWQDALGDLWLLMEDYDRAAAQYQQALELAPEDVDAILGLARVAMGLRDYEDAEARIQQAVEAAPDSADPHVVWGALYLLRDDPSEALIQARQALTADPEDPGAQSLLGWAYLAQGECDSAARAHQEYISAHPRFADGLVGLSQAKLCAGDVDKALAYARDALEMEPYNEDALVSLGLAYSVQGRWEEATSAYVQGLLLSPASAALHNFLADASYQQGDTASAKAEAQVALRLDPDSVASHMVLSSASLGERRHADAEAHAREALAVDETNQLAQLRLGIALLQQGEAASAAEALEGVLEEEPENAWAHFSLGRAYRDLGRYDEAKKELETYLALYPDDPDRSRITSLIERLGLGYHVAEEKAISDLKDTIEAFLEKSADVRVRQLEGEGRTLVVSFDVDPDQEQEDLIYQVSVVVGAATVKVPYIDPPVENGLWIRAEMQGQPRLTARLSLSDAREFADGAISVAGVVARVEFARVVAEEGPASVDDIQSAVSELRALSGTTAVSYRPLLPEDLEKRLTESVDAESRRVMQADEALLVLLGLVEPDLDLEKLMMDLWAEQVAGFYDPAEKAFYVLEAEEQTAWDQMVIAHEYVHALQDEHFDLQALEDESQSADQRLAIEALVEGDATLATLLYASRHIQLVDQLQFASRAGSTEWDVLEASPAFIRGATLFPYDEGLTFAASLYDIGGWASIDEGYGHPPRSTEQVLHPERYRQEDEPQPILLDDLVAQLGDGWSEVRSDVMGELRLRLALAQHIGPAAAAMAAEGWGGDRYALLQRGADGPHVLVLRTGWDDQDEADEFWALFQMCMAHRAGYTEDVKQLLGSVQSHWWLSESGCAFATREDDNVTVILGPDPDTVTQALGIIEGA